MIPEYGVPPPDLQAIELESIKLVWNQIRISDDPGAASWGDLEWLERQVTECLYGKPPDLGRARAYTAVALGLMQGRPF